MISTDQSYNDSQQVSPYKRQQIIKNQKARAVIAQYAENAYST